MRGFTGFYHNGHPCFIREEYEAAHAGEDELTRFEDAVGMVFSDVHAAMSYAYAHKPYLLYRLESDDLDLHLLRGRDPWTAFRGGYAHIVTGEFVKGRKPDYDSYPCWKEEEPASGYVSPGLSTLSGALGLTASLFGFLATLLGGKK